MRTAETKTRNKVRLNKTSQINLVQCSLCETKLKIKELKDHYLETHVTNWIPRLELKLFDQPHLRLPTKNKRPIVKGW